MSKRIRFKIFLRLYKNYLMEGYLSEFSNLNKFCETSCLIYRTSCVTWKSPIKYRLKKFSITKYLEISAFFTVFLDIKNNRRNWESPKLIQFSVPRTFSNVGWRFARRFLVLIMLILLTTRQFFRIV